MKLTSRSEYALLALAFLSRKRPDEYISVSTISKAQSIPPKFLEQILLTLKRAGYIRSLKGSKGGHCLAKHPNKITIAEIVRLLDGALAPTESVSKYFYEPTPIQKEKKMIKLFGHLRDYISDKLENTTLADVR
jgi:Rrf2 family transcriptional regulator, cysteine metabolism repressor